MMAAGFVLALMAYLLGFAFLTYFCVIADPSESSIARCLTQSLPEFCLRNLRRALGPKLVAKIVELSNHFLQIVYLVIVLGSWSIMFVYGYPLIAESLHVSSYHRTTGYLVFVLCMGSWKYACGVGPGYITARTLPKFDNYPYDNLLFVEGSLCPTLKIRKVPRSKFDRFGHVRDAHVPRFDHFCGWLNQSVGEENYRLFLWFLVVHAGMCWYGTYVTYWLFYGEILDKNLLNATFFNAATGAEVKADRIIVFQYLIMRHFYLAGVLLLMSVMALVLSCFLSFHLYITARGMTTNEYFKWKEVNKWHKKETKRYQAALKEGRVGGGGTAGGSAAPPVDDADVTCTGPTSDASSTANGAGQTAASTGDCGEGNDAEPPIMDPGPMPRNIYDQGLVDNFWEVIYPRSRRPDALRRYADALRSSGGVVASTGSCRNGNEVHLTLNDESMSEEVTGKTKAN